jgi:hypothetical protein
VWEELKTGDGGCDGDVRLEFPTTTTRVDINVME